MLFSLKNQYQRMEFQCLIKMIKSLIIEIFILLKEDVTLLINPEIVKVNPQPQILDNIHHIYLA
jgi:hypothetical protein